MVEEAQKPTKRETEEFKDLKDLEWELMRQVSKDDLWTFITQVLYPNTWQEHYVERLHKPLADWITHEAAPGARKLILMPRKHRKSYIVTIAHAVWRIINDPNIRIIIVSVKHSTAMEFMAVIKRVFQKNPTFQKYFPEFHVDAEKRLGNEEVFTHPLRDNHDLADPTLRSSYLGGKLAGKRCDILICDDPIAEGNVATPPQADKALSNFNSLIPVMDTNKRYNMVMVSGTRYGYNDIYGAMLGEARGGDAEVDLKQVDDEGNTLNAYEAIIRHCLEDEDGNPSKAGQPILPEIFSKQILLQMLSQYKIDPDQGEEAWWRQMMNVCQSPDNIKFREEWFDSWVPRLPGNVVWSGIVIDSATKDEQVIMKGDWTAVHLGHFDAYGHLYLSNALHSNTYKSPELMTALAAVAQGDGVYNIVKEKVGEEMFFGMVREKFIGLGMPCSTYPCTVRGQGKKLVRVVEALQAPFMGRKIHFVGDKEKGTGYPVKIWKALKDELTHIGMWSHDDLADALSLFFHKDVRVRPTDFKSHDWVIPKNARLGQTMARKINPASISNWNVRSENTKSDGTLRDDPFAGVLGDRGDGVGTAVSVEEDHSTQTDIGVGNVRAWVAGRRK